MLNFQTISNRNNRYDLLDTYDPNTTTWIVADLDHKKIIQNRLLKKFGWLPEDSCLRATELWTKLLKQVDTSLRVVSPIYIEALAVRWLEKPQGAKSLLGYLEIFLPVLQTEATQQLMKDWLRENPNSLLRWGRWFQECCHFWDHLKEEKVVVAKWLPGILSANDLKLSWDRNIVVDLGPDLSAPELELFRKLSDTTEATVLHPGEEWCNKFPKLFWTYARELGFKGTEKIPQVRYPENWTCSRTTTELSEIKYLTQKIRSWLDQGVSPNEICVFAADPESYWPVISPYFETEGIPLAKARVSLAHSFPSISTWLSRLRLQSDATSSEDHEQKLFRLNSLESPSYEKFRALLSNIYEPQDLERFFVGDSSKNFGRLSHQKFLRDQFIRISLEEWDFSDQTPVLEKVLSSLLLETAVDVQLPYDDWIYYLEALVARTEVKVSEHDSNGVMIRRLTSMYINQERYCFLLNLSESALSEPTPVNISQGEIVKLQNDLGFGLSRPESGKLQFLVEWGFNDFPTEVVLGFADVDFFGDPSSPSIFWTELASQHKDHVLEVTSFRSRWDNIQEAMGFQIEIPDQLAARLAEDLGQEANPVAVDKSKISVSASQLENYAECPFKFLSGKLFKLRTEPEVDLDLDRMRRGSLTHKMLEILLGEDIWKVNDRRLEVIVDEARFAEGIEVDKVFWPSLKRQHVNSLGRFLEFEKSWRTEFPTTKTVGREVQFQGEVFGFPIRGKIDRVDTNSQGQYVVIDYKSSGSGLTAYPKWLEYDSYQLMIYARAIENGWTDLPKGPVIGAFYFDLKELDRTKGFGLVDEGTAFDLYPDPGQKHYRISAQGLKALNAEFDQRLQENLQRIGEGHFAAKPKEPEISCKNCDWRSLCRAPHLNL